MAITIASPLTTAANNIVAINIRSQTSLPKVQREFEDFSRFLRVKKTEIEAISLPSENKIKELGNLNLSNNFGSIGNLLKNLVGGGFDIANFISGMFPGKGEKIGTAPPKGKPKAPPKVSGGKLKFGGIRALGIVNTVFAGLDFATGLAEGESVGKAAAGAGGSLAGSLLGGAIGQALIPIPGVGFVLGSMAGGFLGGYGADRAYETITGDVEQKRDQKLKENELKSKTQTSASKVNSGAFGNILKKFDDAVSKFESFIYGVGSAIMGSAKSQDDEVIQEYGEYPDRDSGDFQSGELPDLLAEGGILPSGKMNSGYRTSRRPDHMGTDYAMPEGTPISVIQPGRVTRAGWFDGYGYGVQVNHPGGVNSFYGHLSSINVKVGQDIDPGTVIGKVGSTGRSTGPHLHFEVDANGKSKVDPTNYADKLFRFGGNVRTKPRETAPIQPTQSQAQLQSQPSISTTSAQLQDTRSTSAVPQTNIPPQALASMQSPQSQPAPSQVQPQSAIENIDELQRKIPEKFKLAQIQPLPQNITASPLRQPPKIQTYPSYSQEQSYIMERQTIISTGVVGGGSQKPIVVPMGASGSGGDSIVISPQAGAQVLNSLMKSILLTNLSST
jgi:murein DD-endopeptidase MepM/ murein hydrolase activator NlpD